eukprot:4072229-Amphidinium_carterae.1
MTLEGPLRRACGDIPQREPPVRRCQILTNTIGNLPYTIGHHLRVIVVQFVITRVLQQRQTLCHVFPDFAQHLRNTSHLPTAYMHSSIVGDRARVVGVDGRLCRSSRHLHCAHATSPCSHLHEGRVPGHGQL